MRIRRVTAHAFGPLVAETLELAEGMTVIVGDNESAKSSWHAAIYAAVCGRRRSRGRLRSEDQHFADLHHPWDGDEWIVSAEVELDDGRRIELRHDLAGRVDCSATDLALGADVSNEIMHDGAPDGSVWLGLDRSVFVATACVEQAQMFRVCADADGLQECLQKAAATAGTDATAVGAIDHIGRFLQERVGLDRANSTKPLRRAVLGVARAQEELAERQKTHEEYLTRVEQLEVLRDEARRVSADVHAAEVSASVELARRAEEQAGRARKLVDRYGATPPESVSSNDALAQRVQQGLTTWAERPVAAENPQPSTKEIEAELRSLPTVPVGDLEAHLSIQARTEGLTGAVSQVRLHKRSRPSEPTIPPPVAAGDQELLELAASLEAPLPTVPPDLVRKEQVTGQMAAASAVKTLPTRLLAGGSLVMVLGLLVVALINLGFGIGICVVGLVLIAVGIMKRTSANPLIVAREHAEAEGFLRVAREQVDQGLRRRQDTIDRCAQLNVAADAATLRAIPVARAHAEAGLRELQSWGTQHEELRARVSEAASSLESALTARGIQPEGASMEQLLGSAEQYREDCRGRAAQASKANRRQGLLSQLSAAREIERRSDADTQARERAAAMIMAAAIECSITAPTPEQAAGGLQSWLDDRAARLGHLSIAQTEWAELQALLDHRPLAELEQLAKSARQKANDLRADADPIPPDAISALTADQELPELRKRASRADAAAARAEGELRQYAAGLREVSEAEEGLAEATAEFNRVRELRDTLNTTRDFLIEAQTRVHRDIAPVLSATLKQWLPRVTGDRYTDAIVDPITLQVQVCGPSRRWRQADRLSYGTAEQIYLLLRVALAERLTQGHDTCPIVLDDVTVHADATRSQQVLELLLAISNHRQVILFTQEQTVAAWAEKTLTHPLHAVRRLAPIPVG